MTKREQALAKQVNELKEKLATASRNYEGSQRWAHKRFIATDKLAANLLALGEGLTLQVLKKTGLRLEIASGKPSLMLQCKKR